MAASSGESPNGASDGGRTERRGEASEGPTKPSALGLAVCAGLGTAMALWSLFQWTQLVTDRTGGEAYCGISEADGQACSAIWDSALAMAVQTTSGLPIAGWGVVWGLVAFALPVWELARRRGENAEEPEHDGGPPVWSAIVVTAAWGLVAVAGLMVTSFRTELQCGSCIVTYALVLSYTMVTYLETPRGGAPLTFRGVSLASAAVGLSFVLLFVPGRRTPQSSTVPSSLVGEVTPKGQVLRAALDTYEIDQLLKWLRGKRLEKFVTDLQHYRTSKVVPLEKPRTLIGAANAPLRITQFTDVHCPACAVLHSNLKRLRTYALRSFSIEPRYFPQDGACNPSLDGESEAPIRCTVARAQICLEGHPDASDLAAILYRKARLLDEDLLYAITEPIISREELAACIASQETERKLQADIASATAYGTRELPIVLLNGRELRTPAGPLLYALVLAQGDPYHPSFETLPGLDELAPDSAQEPVQAAESEGAEPGPKEPQQRQAGSPEREAVKPNEADGAAQRAD